MMMSLKVHLVDFGAVRDGDWIPPTLGPDVGRPDGPVYKYQVGYRWRQAPAGLPLRYYPRALIEEGPLWASAS